MTTIFKDDIVSLETKRSMIMNNELLNQFTRLYTNQDVLSTLVNGDLNARYSNSELHCIDAIGKLEHPNGVQLANSLSMTRGAITKLTGRLLRMGLLERYRIPENKKEVYYHLTTLGEKVFKEHEAAHQKWEERDLQFLKSVSKEQREAVLSFLQDFNEFLEIQIREVES